jgi:hypothetical protein
VLCLWGVSGRGVLCVQISCRRFTNDCFYLLGLIIGMWKRDHTFVCVGRFFVGSVLGCIVCVIGEVRGSISTFVLSVCLGVLVHIVYTGTFAVDA